MKQNKLMPLMAGFVAGTMYVVACGTTGQSIAAAIGNAIDVVFDNTTSGLTATTVQGAIDEVNTRVADLEGADGMSYDNSSSGMTATTVQGAIDELRALLSKSSRTDIETLLIGSWAGSEFIAAGDVDAQGFVENNADFTITFNLDGSYTCSNSTEISSVCSSGTWSQEGMYVRLVSGTNKEVLTIGSISEEHLLINSDDHTSVFAIWALTKS